MTTEPLTIDPSARVLDYITRFRRFLDDEVATIERDLAAQIDRTSCEFVRARIAHHTRTAFHDRCHTGTGPTLPIALTFSFNWP